MGSGGAGSRINAARTSPCAGYDGRGMPVGKEKRIGGDELQGGAAAVMITPSPEGTVPEDQILWNCKLLLLDGQGRKAG